MITSRIVKYMRYNPRNATRVVSERSAIVFTALDEDENEINLALIDSARIIHVYFFDERKQCYVWLIEGLFYITEDEFIQLVEIMKRKRMSGLIKMGKKQKSKKPYYYVEKKSKSIVIIYNSHKIVFMAYRDSIMPRYDVVDGDER